MRAWRYVASARGAGQADEVRMSSRRTWQGGRSVMEEGVVVCSMFLWSAGDAWYSEHAVEVEANLYTREAGKPVLQVSKQQNKGMACDGALSNTWKSCKVHPGDCYNLWSHERHIT